MQIGEAKYSPVPDADVKAGDSVTASENDSFAALIGAASAAIVVFLVMVIAVGVFFYCRRVKVGLCKSDVNLLAVMPHVLTGARLQVQRLAEEPRPPTPPSEWRVGGR